jgi:hypothetical protein
LYLGVRSERAPAQALPAPATKRIFPKVLAHHWCGVPLRRKQAEPERNRSRAAHHHALYGERVLRKAEK